MEELQEDVVKEENIFFRYANSTHAAWKVKTSPSFLSRPHYHCGVVQNVICQMEAEHHEAGKALVSPRELWHVYVPADGS